MVKQILPAIVFVAFLSSCSTFKPLNFTSSKQVATVPAPVVKTKFIEDISVTPPATADKDRSTGSTRNNKKHYYNRDACSKGGGI
jgi:hypothetical protein